MKKKPKDMEKAHKDWNRQGETLKNTSSTNKSWGKK